VGRTGRDPHNRTAEITSVSGLLVPCTIARCSPVSDMAAAEQAVHRMLGSHRVRKRRELFRVAATTVRGIVGTVVSSLPMSIVAAGLAAIISWFTLVQAHLRSGWLS